MEVNAFIAGKENILKRKNANLTKCRSHKILQHLAVVFEKCKMYNSFVQLEHNSLTIG
jgi:hypothetical protein